MAKKEKSLFQQLLEELGIKDWTGVHAFVKELTSGFIQELPEYFVQHVLSKVK